MNDISKRIIELVENSLFCYGKEGGQGYVDKHECKCGGNRSICQAYQDREKFHSYFNGLTMEEVVHRRDEIIEEIKGEFEDSQWFKDNVGD